MSKLRRVLITGASIGASIGALYKLVHTQWFFKQVVKLGLRYYLKPFKMTMLRGLLITGASIYALYKLVRTQWFFKQVVRLGFSYLSINKYDLTKESDKEAIIAHIEQQNKYLYTRTTDTDDDKLARVHWWNTTDNIYMFDLWDKNVVYLCNYKVKYPTNLLLIMGLGVNTLVLKTTSPEITGLVVCNQDNKMVNMYITEEN